MFYFHRLYKEVQIVRRFVYLLRNCEPDLYFGKHKIPTDVKLTTLRFKNSSDRKNSFQFFIFWIQSFELDKKYPWQDERL